MMYNAHGAQHINSIIIKKKSICIALFLVLVLFAWLDRQGNAVKDFFSLNHMIMNAVLIARRGTHTMIANKLSHIV